MVTSACTVHVLVPELLAHRILAQSELRLAGLERLLSKASVESWDHPGLVESLFALFGLPTQSPLPVAPLTHLYDTGEQNNGVWLRADPVYLQPDRDQVLLFDLGHTFSLSQGEANHLVKALNALYQDIPLQFFAPTPHRWYLSLPTLPNLTTYPPTTVFGKNIHDYLPAGEEAMLWRHRLNEIQMLFHQNPVNQDREIRGELPINSVWFWGLGQLPTISERRWTQVWSNEILALGLAQQADCPHTSVPGQCQEWLSHLVPGEHLLTLTAPVGDIENWHDWLVFLEQLWFMPLVEALKKHQLERVLLYPGDGRVFIITHNSIRHWWRRRRPWQGFIG